MMLSGESAISIRQFDEIEMSSYSGKKDFAYMNLTIQPPSIWQRLQWRIGRFLTRLFSNPNTPWISNFVFYAVLFFVLGAVIFYILKLRFGGGLSSDSRYSPIRSVSIQSTKDLDFDALISDLYLKTLTFLDSKDLIKLKPWKSPYDYEKELNKEVSPSYVSLTSLFEHVWYGDFNANINEFHEGQQLAGEIKKRVK